MAKIDTSTCPKCGAPLQLHAGMSEIQCPYCGNVALVQQGRQPVQQPPNAPPMMVVRVGPQGPSPALFIVPLAIGLVATIVAVSLSARHSASGGLLGASDDRLSFDDAPMLADANGDGVPDVIGHCQTYSFDGKETHFLAAFEGATGKQLWRSAPASKETFDGKRAIVGAYVINVDDLGKVQAYRIANGAPAWSALLGEKARWFCEEGTNVLIEAEDDTYTRFELATGKKSPGPAPAGSRQRPPCKGVYQSPHIDETPTTRKLDWPDFEAYGLPELHATAGMSATNAIAMTDKKGFGYLLGSKDKGTSVAMVAAIENGKVLWKDVVPGIDPLTTNPGDPDMAAVGGGRVVVPYNYKKSDGVRMAAFDTKNGVRVWDVEVHATTQVESGIAIEAGRVYYASWTALYVLSLADGKRLFLIGHEF